MCGKDEDEIIDTAKEQYRVLKTENEFRYGYKVVVVSQTFNRRSFWLFEFCIGQFHLLVIYMNRRKGT